VISLSQYYDNINNILPKSSYNVRPLSESHQAECNSISSQIWSGYRESSCCSAYAWMQRA